MVFLFCLVWANVYAQNLDSLVECQDILGKARRDITVFDTPKYRRFAFEHRIKEVGTISRGEIFNISGTRERTFIGLWAYVSTYDISGWVHLGSEINLESNFFKTVPWHWVCDPRK